MEKILLKRLLEKYLAKQKNVSCLKKDDSIVYIRINGKKVFLKDIYTAEGFINIETEDK